MANISQRDPVLLGICSQTDLDKVVEIARLEATTSNESKKMTEDALDKQ